MIIEHLCEICGYDWDAQAEYSHCPACGHPDETEEEEEQYAVL